MKKENNSNMKYSDSHKGENYGLNYDTILYDKSSYDSVIWRIEEVILNKILRKFDRSQKVLDFACGTGRVSEFIEKLGFKNVCGFDVSSEMLEKAKTKLSNVKLVNIDINSENVDSYKSKFKVITAFRFFLNADNELKRKTFKQLSCFLADDGVLVFNIHGNSKSLRFFYVMLFNMKKRLVKLLFNKSENIFSYKKQTSVSEIKKYLEASNLEIIEIISYSFLTKALFMIIPRKLFLFLENKLVSRSRLNGTHLIFIVRKNDKKGPIH